jgi:hypothetical protein
MTRYIYSILLPLALACANPILASATRCIISEAHTQYCWHTSCADADLHQADAPADRRWEGRRRSREQDPWSQIRTREMHVSLSSLWSSRMSWWRARTGLATVPGVPS